MPLPHVPGARGWEAAALAGRVAVTLDAGGPVCLTISDGRCTAMVALDAEQLLALCAVLVEAGERLQAGG